jgi:hypothetical protein
MEASERARLELEQAEAEYIAAMARLRDAATPKQYTKARLIVEQWYRIQEWWRGEAQRAIAAEQTS